MFSAPRACFSRRSAKGTGHHRSVQRQRIHAGAARIECRCPLRAIEKLSAWGGTALYDVIARSVDLLSRRGRRKAVVVFSDGEDRNSDVTFEDVQRLVDDQDAAVFMIGLGRGTQRPNAGTAKGTRRSNGGLAVFADDPDDSRDLREMVDTLANQSTLGFEPRRDGKQRRITVEMPGRGFRVRAQKRTWLLHPEAEFLGN